MNVRSAALCCAFSCGRALELSSRLLARVRRVDAGGEAYAAARHFVVGGEVLGRVLPQAAEALGGTGLFDVSDEAVALPEEPGAADVVAARTARLAAAFGRCARRARCPCSRAGATSPSRSGRRSTRRRAPSSSARRRRSSRSVWRLCVGSSSTPRRAAGGRLAGPPVAGEADLAGPARRPRRGRLEGRRAARRWRRVRQEAGLSAALLAELRPAGAVSYTGLSQDGWGAKPDTLYVFDLPLPDDWTPAAVGEVERRRAVADLLDRLARDDDAWKPNVSTVLVDFVLRHGFVDPDEADYLSSSAPAKLPVAALALAKHVRHDARGTWRCPQRGVALVRSCWLMGTA
ncbi:hypothetical protein JL720_8954 [Aureococcus anophagefferens]|nr:hypothetical protein JL720_8954 [Aureococcus anophagefferens]